MASAANWPRDFAHGSLLGCSLRFTSVTRTRSWPRLPSPISWTRMCGRFRNLRPNPRSPSSTCSPRRFQFSGRKIEVHSSRVMEPGPPDSRFQVPSSCQGAGGGRFSIHFGSRKRLLAGRGWGRSGSEHRAAHIGWGRSGSEHRRAHISVRPRRSTKHIIK
jgi:hypothetical protein